MSDNKKKDGDNLEEKEFYNLPRKEEPEEEAGRASAGSDTREIPEESKDAIPDRPEDGEAPQKPRRDFQIDLSREVSKIPDYTYTKGHAATRTKRRMSVFMKSMMAIIILGVSILLSIVIIFCAQEVFGLGKKDQPLLVDIPRNAGLSQVADKLEAVGVIRSAELFKIYYKLTKPEGSFQYGTYSLNSNMSYDVMLSELFKYSASDEEVTVTFPEGMTIYQMAKLLESKDVCSADEFIQVVDSQNFGYDFETGLSENSLRYHPLEGYFFPDTYNFYKYDNPSNVADKIFKNFENKIKDLEGKMKEMGYTMEETLIIASIVQKEAGETGQMKNVASVYSNRLQNEGTYPNLQADPTRDYANELKKQMGDQVNQEILDAYNTYEGKGLPPGPICNPGIDAIEATLSPAKTDYYYFCNNLTTGEFFYARTLEEHEKNIIKAGLR